MPVYRYKALKGGTTLDGMVTADSPADGRARLRASGLQLLKFEAPSAPAGPRKLQMGVWRFAAGGSAAALNEVTHYLAMLLRAGVSLAEALDVVTRQAPRSLEAVLRRVSEKVKGGADLGEALAEEKGVFDPAYIGIVRVGQASGALEEALERLVSLRRRRHQLRQRVQAAMAYPLIVTGVGVLVVLFLLTFVVPQITGLLVDSGRAIPWPTRILLAATSLVRHYWWLGLVLALGLALGLTLGDRRNQIRRRLTALVLKIPLIGTVAMKAAIAQFSAMLETMLGSGLPLDEALELTQRSTHNPILQREIKRMLEALRGGQPLGAVRPANTSLPPVVLHILSVGEQSGQLEPMLGELAASYDADVDVAARQAVSVLEPLLIIVISLIVGFIVLATILPIIRLSGSL